MSSVVVVGTQWGDEGKGKITDFLSEHAEIIARYQGGDNAGHTIKFDGETYKLQLIPSGIFYDDKLSIIGNGMVVNPKALLREMKYLQDKGVNTSTLRISNRAHVILPYHIRLDEADEARRGDNKIGTTNKGIGPAYMDKASRVGIRMVDLLDKEVFKEKLLYNLGEKNRMFERFYEVEGFTFEEIFEEFYEYGQQIKELICDTSIILNDALDENKRVLFEGAQGVMLDIDQGTYPYVTSSNPTAGGVANGSGVGPSKIDYVVGVVKAYSSRVGDGPFPTQLDDEIGERIREIGREYGTVTGRKRRVGWFDSVVVSHACRVSGLTDLSIMLLDVLSGLDTLKICTAYKYNGAITREFPASLKELAKCEPVYEEMSGWSEDITGVTSFEELPKAAQRYVERIAELTKVPVSMFSVGPDRKQTIVLKDVWSK